MDKLIYLVPVMGIIGLLYTLVKFKWVSRQEAGTDRMKEIANYIAEGAMAFLRAEWKILGYFVVIVALLLGVMAQANPHSHWSIAIAFVFVRQEVLILYNLPVLFSRAGTNVTFITVACCLC